MKNFVVVIGSLFLSCFVSLHQACNHLDQDSLLSLNFHLSSDPPLNWTSSTDCCLWEGIKCAANARVIHLWLPWRGLTGSISPSIGNLTHLSHVTLSHNRLSGPLHIHSFSSLILLETLDLSYNYFSGEFPSSMSSNRIKSVDISSNQFFGTIPSSFFQLPENLVNFNISNNGFTGHIPFFSWNNKSLCSLRLLDLSNNDFIGQVPLGLGNCSNLQTFRAGFNYLSGSIPDDIYASTSLQEISLPVNQLSGTISNRIIGLQRLSILELHSNKLSGLIPQDIGKLVNLKYLLLHTNNLSGYLPPSLINCSNLIRLNLRINKFKGDLSAYNFSTLPHLQTLDLGNNFFTGSFPETLTSCKSLTAIRLSANKLEGPIPPDIVALQSLSFLSLSNNNFTSLTGGIMTLMGCKNLRILILCMNFFNEAMPNESQITISSDGFQNLEVLGIGDSELTGPFPAWISNLKNLQVLDLGTNKITGRIPGWLANMTSLFYVDLSHNLISGEFPEELCRMPALALERAKNQADGSHLQLPLFMPRTKIHIITQQYDKLFNLPPAIYLRNNSLSGQIPVEIGRLKFLRVLDLSLNNFSGNIPKQISQLTDLEGLDLSRNNLQGEIPWSFINLHFLSSFSVADNDLQGQVPSTGQFHTFPSSSFEGNPRLCRATVQRSCSNFQPSENNVDLPSQSSKNKELHYGLIAGAVFGFIIGSLSGILYPLHRSKFLGS